MTHWRDLIRVHPAADLFPMMTDEELRGEDIKKNGLTAPLAVWAEGADDLMNRKPKAEDFWLLDGRNRLEAIERAGLEITLLPSGHFDIDDLPRRPTTERLYELHTSYHAFGGMRAVHEKWVDPYTCAQRQRPPPPSDGEQKRELIAKVPSSRGARTAR